MRPVRLAILVSSDRRRGAEVFGETLARSIGDQGWQVRLWSLSTAPDGPRIAAEALSTVTPDSLSRFDRSVISGLRQATVTFAPDIVLANGSSTLQYAVAALRTMRNRPRLVYTSIGDPMYWIRSPRHRLLRTGILKGVDRVFSVSSVTARQLIDHLGVAPDKIRIAPTGVGPRFFEVERRASDGPLRVAFIGALSPEKDPLAALSVIRHAAESASIVGRFLGDGPLGAELTQAVAAANLSDRIELLGSVPDVLPHLAWADVLVLTSETEGLPGVVLEAAAAGVPAVVFDVGGVTETVIDESTGRIVAPGDISSAAEALVTLANDRNLAAQWGDAARQMAAERFRLDDAVDRYRTLLEAEIGATGGQV